MTAKTYNFSQLLVYNPLAQGFNPVVSASLFPSTTTPNEGTNVTFRVTAWNVPDNTSLYWRVGNLVNLTTDRFNATNSTVNIVNNRGTFVINVNENSTTATGTQTYDVIISKTLNGPALATVLGITVADTSQSVSNIKVIRIDPYNHVGTGNANTVVNSVDNGQTLATLHGVYTSTAVQGGITTITSIDSGIVLPAKSVRTVTMWIRFLDSPISGTRYLIDSRISASGDYFYTGSYNGWVSCSVNGGIVTGIDGSTFNSLASVVNTWQFITLISINEETNPISLFNRYTFNEALAPIQFGVIEAYNYILSNTEVASAYQADKTRYDPPAPGALQITTSYSQTAGSSPTYRAILDGVPNSQWAAIRSASSFILKRTGQTIAMTYITDSNTGSFQFGIGAQQLYQGDSFWYVP